ncbi:hypothetical protein U1839_23365 [Sphingomonas sp. RT2P30]|uniref:hypothetical protein n=1 Tax=Parasphingomonas halimpatiens TaxID=3096162 RepID=UPI002FCBAD10
MSEHKNEWDGEIVRKWLESRFSAAQSDQDRADKHGRAREDDYDKAAAEEFVCRLTKSSESTNSQGLFVERLKQLLDQKEFRCVGVHDERRFEREVRSYLRKLMKMTRASAGFENTSRYQ